jgi:hypothetical protein
MSDFDELHCSFIKQNDQTTTTTARPSEVSRRGFLKGVNLCRPRGLLE